MTSFADLPNYVRFRVGESQAFNDAVNSFREFRPNVYQDAWELIKQEDRDLILINIRKELLELVNQINNYLYGDK